MIRFAIPLFFLTFFALFAKAQSEQPLRFAFVTDTHIGAPATAAEDLQRTVADINTQSGLAFVVVTGDLTDFGTETELRETKRILDQLIYPYYVFPGNHDSKWSENGCNVFRQVFGAERFAFTAGKYRFVGCGSGPNMRMSPGLVAREDVLWVKKELETLKRTGQPLIFMNHYPLDESLANWYLLTDELKGVNVQAAFCGHGHRNRSMNFEGIPAVMGRSNLRATDPVGGYNLVTIQNDTMRFEERTPGLTTRPVWNTIVLRKHDFSKDNTRHPRPSYALNQTYPNVRPDWEKQDSSDIGAGIVADRRLAVYPNTHGQVVALDPETGRDRWRFQTGGKVYATPALTSKGVVVASTDGTVYYLNRKNGNVIWKQATGRPLVASPLVDGKTVYIGSSEGKFRAFSLKDGAKLWEFDGVSEFVESIPAADDQRVYFGSWGSTLYALDKSTGKLAWKWTNGKLRNFSPAACTPILAHNRVFIQTPDRTVTALDAATGREIWKSSQHKGFESIGASEDKSVIYIKCMQDSVYALSTRSGQMQADWFVNCRYGYEISPSPITEKDGVVFVPTDDGVIYGLDKSTRRIRFAHKLSNAMVNRIQPLSRRRVLVTTMDGKVAALRFE